MTLAQTGNMRKAGEILRISTPALSKAMRVLEEEVEAKLWIRDGRRVILTDSGRALAQRIPEMMETFRKLKDTLQKPVERGEVLRIGTFESFSTYFLTFLDRLKWESARLQLHELLPGQIEKHVASGEIDIGLTYLPILDPELDFLKAASIEMGVFTRVGAFKDVAQKDLPFAVPILPLQGIPTRVRGLDGWPEDAYRRKVRHQVTMLESALELCRQGRVAVYIPVFIAEEHNRRVKPAFQLERRRSPFPGRLCKSDVYLVKRKSMEETAAVKKLAKAVRLICGS